MNSFTKVKTYQIVGSLNKKHAIFALTFVILCIIFGAYYQTNYTPIVREGNASQRNLVGATGAQRLPHAIIIGVRKAGTRAMLSYLMGHPDIKAANAEVHFFSKDRNYRQGLYGYRQVMPYSRPDQITMEKTPSYFHSDRVPERIYDMNSSIRLILVVRNPVERAISEYVHYKVKKPWFRYSFEEITYPEHPYFEIVQRSAYIKFLKKWLRYFKKEQILVIDGDKLAHDPLGEMKIAEDFLGVRQYLDETYFIYNKEKGFYCIRDKNGKQEHCLGASKGRPHPEVDEQIKQKLRQYYTPYNEKLFELIGRRFDWDV